MNGADDIYDARIKELAAKARDLGPVEHADCRHEADNFLCGDRVTVEVERDGDRIKALGGKVRGCLLTQAAAALAAQAAPGLDVAGLMNGIEQAKALMADGTPATGAWEGLNAFTPVHDARHRHDCVLLPFQALAACLDQTEPRDG
ncbi:iron-sulfur cluster assembly scaffold protein [Thalassospiraceae bacterium LMO-SO8]|nr:iron-sulfur cluster assembly scaffold protein [Alphaproteobacteria bacterium LMO-S08]WND76768.1 iron-sulfur cluster assembly scaffold protein [Thalassospiraceae bacterium LMO-SO8]